MEYGFLRSVEYGFCEVWSIFPYSTLCEVWSTAFLRSVEYGFYEVWSTGFSKCGVRVFVFTKCGVQVFGTEKYSAVRLLLELMNIYGNG